MTWESDPLRAKAKLFFERALSIDSRDDPEFGLWCSFGLELLARSAVASISPTLLANPDSEQKSLLYALNRGPEGNPQSIAASRVFALCKRLFSEFTEENLKASLALTNRRNEELHSGAAAFDGYRQNQWIVGFYRACNSLAGTMGETLVTLFGEEEACAAIEMLRSDEKEVMQRVQKNIAAHRQVFQDKPEKERLELKESAARRGQELSTQKHHRQTCPACECIATVCGTPFGKERVSHDDGDIVVRQLVSPTSFSCGACELSLNGYAELEAAKLGGQYTRTTTYSPEEYYSLINPDDPGALQPFIDAYLADEQREYDNE